MGSVVFDFDSTLVPVESLEALLAAEDLSAETRAEIARLTDAGMTGALSFSESLRARLELARPRRAALDALARRLAAAPTDGAAALIADLHAGGHEVWIVSGGFRDLLVPVGAALGLPEARVHGVASRWAADGSFAGLEPDDAFARSKVEGVRAAGIAFARPAIGVGDGATDLALRDAGLVDVFVAYTEHVARPEVVGRADHEASDMRGLGVLMGKLWA